MRVTALGWLKRLVPAAWRPRMRSAWVRLRNAGVRHRCNVCGAGLRRFAAHGVPEEANFRCPVCHSKPPHRLAELFFSSHPDLFRVGGLLVHVAPELGLGRRLSKMAELTGMHYRGGGITGVGDTHLDLLAMPFASDSVSLLYCCHVLNCLQDDRQAMREVCRVMRADGVAVLQVPAFCQGPDTIETQSLDQRLSTFSDAGIYRCYTNADYEQRLRDAGFDVVAHRATQVPSALIDRHQLKSEVLHVCRKRTELAT